MENLNYIKTTDLVSGLIRVGDLVNFDGPLLTLFEDIKNDHLYLYDWVDRNNNSNRWLVYQVEPIALNNFINGKITHLELYNSLPYKKIYFSDIANNDMITNSNLFEIDNLPIQYLPTEDLFDSNDCKSIIKIKTIVFKSLMRRKSNNQYNLGLSHISRILKLEPTVVIKNKLVSRKNYFHVLRQRTLENEIIYSTNYNSINSKQQVFSSVIRTRPSVKQNIYAHV